MIRQKVLNVLIIRPYEELIVLEAIADCVRNYRALAIQIPSKFFNNFSEPEQITGRARDDRS